MKKYYFCFCLAAFVAANLFVSCDSSVWREESAENLFKAIANNDPHAFNWITVEEVDKLDGKDKEKIDKLRSFACDIDKNVPPLLAEWRKLGEDAGINWKDIKVDTVYVTYSGDSEYEQLGAEVQEGYILA